jgi:hypothetical protein
MTQPPLTQAGALKEMTDRLRRMETRLTRFMEAMGFDTEVRRPQFRDGLLDLPTDAASVRDCLAAVPAHWHGPIELIHKGHVIAVLTKQ